ncbi:hypothetical protein VTJ49DRAFT_3939 [Mycothermus thermophilus]|uniref:C2H2-type domain-containing protein n=1 Tax=Humicola insolens TaxID=85995 RepID=A0ABR3V6L5_HUMIN
MSVSITPVMSDDSDQCKPDPEDGSASPGSLESDELRESRPNRFRGHPSTWRTWTEADRQTWVAFENSRRADLAVHLYNAFALRRGLRRGPDVDDSSEQQGWDPGKPWTAWPMRASEVPDDGLLPRNGDDVNEPFTLRREPRTPPFAGCMLEEEIAAVMLRCATERLRRRGLDGGGMMSSSGGRGGGKDDSGEQVMPSIESAEEEDGSEDDDAGETTGRDDETDSPGRAERLQRRKKTGSPSFAPAVSVDDDRSYALLRPEARRIMARLDDTLAILHNQRVAGLGHMSESSSSSSGSDEEEDEDKVKAEPASRSPSLSPTPPPKSRRGRPRKVHVPREGETEREMLIRIAREGKRRIPKFSDDEGNTGRESRSRSRSRSKGKQPSRTRPVSDDEDTVDRKSRSKGKQPPRPRPVSTASSRASSVSRASSQSKSSITSEKNREKLFARWGLRDWRDVLGAAALAGFSPKVIARAAQRCATLFREDMTIHTLHGPGGVETSRYVPDAQLPVSSDEDDEAEIELAQRRAVSRQPSVFPGESASPEPEPESRRGRSRSRSAAPKSLLCPHSGCPRAVEPFTKKSNFERHLREIHHDSSPLPTGGATTDVELTEPEIPSRSRSRSRRSRSGTPAPGAHLCPYLTCPRALEGFTKRTNLARHLREVHGRRKQAAKAAAADTEDSADEMEDGVHADRFLRPIRIRKGWRGEDAARRPVKRARAASEELDSFL